MSRSIPAAIALLFALSAPHGAAGQAPTLAEPAEAAVEVAVEAAVEPVVEAPVTAEVETPAEIEPAAAAPTPAPVIVEPAPSYAITPAATVCCPIEVVAERTSLHAKRFLRCSGPQTRLTACVDNPADCYGKLYAVPLCVPCCCTGEPRPCNARTGRLGRGYVDLVWGCGYVAKVTFLKHGGVIITYTAG